MTDDARRVLTEEERDCIHAARRAGATCAICGRVFVEGEVIWIERLAIHAGHGEGTYWRAPVGAECVTLETVRATCKATPEHCAGCGRGIYYGATGPSRRRLALCSRRCSSRYHAARVKEARQ